MLVEDRRRRGNLLRAAACRVPHVRIGRGDPPRPPAADNGCRREVRGWVHSARRTERFPPTGRCGRYWCRTDRFTVDVHRIPAVTIPAKVRHTPLRCVAAGAPRLELRAHAEHPPTCLGPDPPVSGTAGSSAAGLSPLRPGALGSQTPTRRCAEAATGSGSVGCRRTTRHRHPSAQHRAPRSKRRRGALGPDDTPCAPSGHDQTCPGPVTAGNPRSTSPRIPRSAKPRSA